MPYKPDLDHRHTIRLQGYDYFQSGAYFVTLCTHNKIRLFGEVIDEQVKLNAAGAAAKNFWQDIPSHFPDATLDQFVIMPNHVHGIILLLGASEGANDYSPLEVDNSAVPHGTSRTVARSSVASRSA